MKGISVQYGVERCPHCDVSLVGEMVPVERRRALDWATNYNRATVIRNGFLNPAVKDYLICPDCKERIDGLE